MSIAPTQLQQRSWFPGAAIVAIAASILAGAYAFQYLGGLPPCPLCLEQRVPWFVLMGIGGAIVAAHAMGSPQWLLIALYTGAALVAVWSAAFGLYHAGIEYSWWKGPPSCTASGAAGEIKLLEPGSRPAIALCDVAPWSLLGISLAGFNFLFSLGVGALAAWGGWRLR